MFTEKNKKLINLKCNCSLKLWILITLNQNIILKSPLGLSVSLFPSLSHLLNLFFSKEWLWNVFKKNILPTALPLSSSRICISKNWPLTFIKVALNPKKGFVLKIFELFVLAGLEGLWCQFVVSSLWFGIKHLNNFCIDDPEILHKHFCSTNNETCRV